MLHLPFPPAPFFLFHFYKIPARLCFSICFFNLSPILVTAWSLPPSQAFYLTLTCLWVLLGTALIVTLIQRAFTYRSHKSFENSLNSKKSWLGCSFPLDPVDCRSTNSITHGMLQQCGWNYSNYLGTNLCVFVHVRDVTHAAAFSISPFGGRPQECEDCSHLLFSFVLTNVTVTPQY